MKKNMFVMAVIVSLALGTVYLTASTTSTLRVDVPFAFSVGKLSLPAGQYIVQFERLGYGTALGTSLVIRNENGKIYQRVLSLPAHDIEIKSGAQLVFNKYANSYFLARVESFGLACDLKKSTAEKELAARFNHRGQPVSVAAD